MPARRKAVDLLRAAELGPAYERAWKEWSASGEAADWETTVGDGIAGIAAGKAPMRRGEVR